MSVKHPEINLFMLFPALFGAFTIVLLWILQPTMEDAGVAVALFGFLWGLISFREFFSQSLPIRLMSGWESENTLLSVAAVVTAVAAVYGALLVKIWLLFIYAVRLLPWWRPCRNCMRWFSAR